MIQFKRKLYGLDKLHYDYIDTDSRSRNIFRLLEFPETFNLGKNQFKLLANNEVLVKNSRIYIDIVDANGEAIYYEISPIANKDNSRSIIVYIYPNTPAGNCTVRMASRLGIDPRSKEKIYYNDNIIDEPNVLWSKVVNVSPYLASESRIKFLKEPRVKYLERQQFLQEFSGSRTLVNALPTGTGSISINSPIRPMQFIDDPRSIEKTDIKIREVGQPSVTGNSTGISNVYSIPYFSENSIITSDGFEFSSSMQGGIIYARKILIQSPADAAESTLFFNITYSASIVNVISKNQIEVYPPFSIDFSYSTTDGRSVPFSIRKFANHTNFTASYYNTLSLTSSLTTQSFVELNLYDIEPVSGIVDSVNVSYKPINSFGDFIDLGDYTIRPKNLLVDSGSIIFSPKDGIVEYPIGYFTSGSAGYSRYWENYVVGNTTASVSGSDNGVDVKISDGIVIYHTNSGSDGRYVYARPKSLYDAYITGDTEINLKFSTFSQLREIDHINFAQLDVYISGSVNLITDVVSSTLPLSPVKNADLGIYVGSVTSKDGIIKDNDISFIVKNDSYIRPVFVVRTGIWHIGKIQMLPRQELGFGPNQSKLFVPLDDVKRETELIMRVQYADKVGIRSEIDTLIYGVLFRGGSQIQFSELENVPKTVASGSFISSGSYQHTYITHSTDQVNISDREFQVEFPIFISDISNEIYSGSNYNVAIGYKVETIVFGRTGSRFAPMNSHVWGGTLQGRVIVSSTVNTGIPTVYNTIFLSGSNVNSIGTFGTGYAFNNLDSWFGIIGAQVANSNRDLRVRYFLRPTSSFYWDLDIMSTCTVWKHETYFFS